MQITMLNRRESLRLAGRTALLLATSGSKNGAAARRGAPQIAMPPLDRPDGSVGRRITRTSFGMHLVGVTGWSQPGGARTPPVNFGCGSVRVWDTGATWRMLNPARNRYDWRTLDAEMAQWRKAYRDVLFCLGQAPDWATRPKSSRGTYSPHVPNDPAYGAEFVTELLNRYPQIKAVEIWNEPNFERYFDGTIEQLVAITKAQATAARAARRDIIVVSAAPQPFSDGGAYFGRYLTHLQRANAGSLIDALGCHTYVQPREPEIIGPLVERLRKLADDRGFHQPLWSTEFGWGEYRREEASAIERTHSMAEQQAIGYLLRGFAVSLGYGLERQYYYAADKDFSLIHLFADRPRLRIAAPGHALAVLADMLDGAILFRPFEEGGVLSQKFRDSAGRFGNIVWTRSGAPLMVRPPPGAHAYNCFGTMISVDSPIQLSGTPIYLRAPQV